MNILPCRNWRALAGGAGPWALAAPTPVDWPEPTLLDGSVLPPAAWRGLPLRHGAADLATATHCGLPQIPVDSSPGTARMH